MSDMLAVLLGAGGGAASQAVAALAGGKSGAKAAPGQQGGEDPFLAVLFDRLAVLQEKPGVAVEGGDPALLSDAEQDGAELAEGVDTPLKPLEIALLQAHQSGGEASAQIMAGMIPVPAAAIADVAKAVAAASKRAAEGVVGLEGQPEAETTADAGRAPSTKTKSGAALSAANARSGAAETAAEGQVLPRGRGREASDGAVQPAQSGRLDVPPGASVAQGLAMQGQVSAPVAEGTGVAPTGQSVQTIAAGMGHGMSAMGDVHGRQAASPVHMSIDSPLRGAMFQQELGERMVWLSSRHGQVAEIALNPPHLGPLEVKLSVSGGEAGAQFFSPHAQVRDAIEAALPRLREMMAEAGVTLGQAHVRDESFPREDGLAQGGGQGKGGDDGDEPDGGILALGGGFTGRGGQGLVDLYV